MRLLTSTLIVLAALFLLILLFPAVFLEATSSVLQDPYQQIGGEILAGFSKATGRPLTASGVYDVLIIRHPESADLYLKKSETLLQAGDEKGALISLDASIARDPLNPFLLAKKIRLLMSEGKIRDAEPLYSTILTIQTDNPEYLSVIADVALERNLYTDAFDRYTRLLSINPGDGLTWEKRSDVIFALLTIPTAGAGASEALRQTDLFTEGMTGYEKALTFSPERSAIIRTKIMKRSEEYVPRTIQELNERYQQYRYLKTGGQSLH